ncbi:hypothetical protein ASC77_03490 [Nocardioides sp. Root1257]|uniref:hypothetical protein n=1 Tax=unclassified Nocardioides TaxID=2615069 RepID=UPI0006F72DCF|nr:MULTISPECIES: hypothetical protein [unclassified Nocardioides]KQW53359.1 hypothetical protein ASC77_03490 [Nocardioides sp. Root1257]KRC56045.1 hypothetical protein ASE24_03490 [Nocardioides sp. Root224]
MRRISATALLVATLLGITPATAADVPAPSSETTVHLWDGALPDGVTTVQAACDDQQQVVGAPQPLDAGFTVPSIPSYRTPWPHGRFALQLSPDDGSIAGYEVVRPSVLDLMTAGATVYTFGTAGGLRTVLDVTTADGAWQLTARGYIRSGTPPTDYARYDTRGRVYTWAAGDESRSGTLDEFVAQHGDGPTTAHLWVGQCPSQPGGPGGGSVVDGLRLGNADVTTYDAEKTVTQLSAGGASGVPGQVRMVVYCVLRGGSPVDGIVGEQLVFEVRPHGHGPFRQIGAATTGAGGSASMAIRPRTNIDYRCTYAGNDGSSGTPSPPLVSTVAELGVTTHLTIRARRTHHGKRVLVTGTADPEHPGTKVALRATRIGVSLGGPVIARSRLTASSSYELRARLAPGTWELTVWIAKAPGNSAGTSVRRYVR